MELNQETKHTEVRWMILPWTQKVMLIFCQSHHFDYFQAVISVILRHQMSVCRTNTSAEGHRPLFQIRYTPVTATTIIRTSVSNTQNSALVYCFICVVICVTDFS